MCTWELAIAGAGLLMQAKGASDRAAADNANLRTAEAIRQRNANALRNTEEQNAVLRRNMEALSPQNMTAAYNAEQDRIGGNIASDVAELQNDPARDIETSGRISDAFISDKARKRAETLKRLSTLGSLAAKTLTPQAAAQNTNFLNTRFANQQGTLASQGQRVDALDVNKVAGAGVVRPTPGAEMLQGIGQGVTSIGMIGAGNSLADAFKPLPPGFHGPFEP